MSAVINRGCDCLGVRCVVLFFKKGRCRKCQGKEDNECGNEEG